MKTIRKLRAMKNIQLLIEFENLAKHCCAVRVKSVGKELSEIREEILKRMDYSKKGDVK